MKANRTLVYVACAWAIGWSNLALAAEIESVAWQAKVDELLAPWNRSDAPGVVIAVLRDGRVLYERAYGMADLERGAALTMESVFEIGSTSKQFTAMCVLLLERQGKLNLDDDIRKYVPELPVYEKPITIRHLVHHTSGIRDAETLFALAGISYRDSFSNAQILELIARQRGLNFEPGSQFLYSNSGYTLLGIIVERVSGQSLRAFSDEHIFRPLGMRHTVFWDDSTGILRNRALAYAPGEGGRLRDENWSLAFIGPAGLHTTAGDLALWDANFYDNKLGGGAELISKMLVVGTRSDDPMNYAAGLLLGRYRDLETVRHDGAWMGYRAELLRFPTLHFSVICLSNHGAASPSDLAYGVADVVLDEVLGHKASESGAAATPTPATIDPNEVTAYTGGYWNPSLVWFRTIEVREGKLWYASGTGGGLELQPLGANRFLALGLPWRLEVHFEDKGAPSRITTHFAGENPLHLEKFDVVPATSAALAAYAGDYRSDELRTDLRLQLKDGQIVATLGASGAPKTTEPGRRDELRVPGLVGIPWDSRAALLRFERNRKGQVTGLYLSTGFALNLHFPKQPKR